MENKETEQRKEKEEEEKEKEETWQMDVENEDMPSNPSDSEDEYDENGVIVLDDNGAKSSNSGTPNNKPKSKSRSSLTPAERVYRNQQRLESAKKKAEEKVFFI
jgi:hypothetical protein